MSAPIAPVRAALPLSPPREGDVRPVKPLTGEVTRQVRGQSTPDRRAVAVDRSRVDPAVIQVAEGMESMFLDYMMKVMRQTVPESEMSLQNPATKIYQSMLDSEYAQKAARAGGLGLADQIIAYLEAGRYTQNRGGIGPAPTGGSRQTGGTNEGQSSDPSSSGSER